MPGLPPPSPMHGSAQRPWATESTGANRGVDVSDASSLPVIGSVFGGSVAGGSECNQGGEGGRSAAGRGAGKVGRASGAGRAGGAGAPAARRERMADPAARISAAIRSGDWVDPRQAARTGQQPPRGGEGRLGVPMDTLSVGSSSISEVSVPGGVPALVAAPTARPPSSASSASERNAALMATLERSGLARGGPGGAAPPQGGKPAVHKPKPGRQAQHASLSCFAAPPHEASPQTATAQQAAAASTARAAPQPVHGGSGPSRGASSAAHLEPANAGAARQRAGDLARDRIEPY